MPKKAVAEISQSQSHQSIKSREIPDKVASYISSLLDQIDADVPGLYFSEEQLTRLERMLGKNIRESEEIITYVGNLRQMTVAGVEVSVPQEIIKRLRFRSGAKDDQSFGNWLENITVRLLRDLTNLREPV